jgi:uncharacterized protein (DUF2252 family)
MDSAYWMKGCSSLGLLRNATLIRVGKSKSADFCLIDIKEGAAAQAPSYKGVVMPKANGERIVEGARHISPYLGNRMCSARLLDKSVFVRELLPQDLKLEVGSLSAGEAILTAGYLATAVGHANARQMNSAIRKEWQADLKRNRSKTLAAPSWLWTSIVDLLISHEKGYLEHCRKFARSSA